jgi:outer membrane lipoprotein-sorting protein
VIYIFIDKKDFTASKLELHELSGDYTIIKFSNKIINSNLQDDLFKTN